MSTPHNSLRPRRVPLFFSLHHTLSLLLSHHHSLQNRKISFIDGGGDRASANDVKSIRPRRGNNRAILLRTDAPFWFSGLLTNSFPVHKTGFRRSHSPSPVLSQLTEKTGWLVSINRRRPESLACVISFLRLRAPLSTYFLSECLSFIS